MEITARANGSEKSNLSHSRGSAKKETEIVTDIELNSTSFSSEQRAKLLEAGLWYSLKDVSVQIYKSLDDLFEASSRRPDGIGFSGKPQEAVSVADLIAACSEGVEVCTVAILNQDLPTELASFAGSLKPLLQQMLVFFTSSSEGSGKLKNADLPTVAGNCIQFQKAVSSPVQQLVRACCEIGQ